MLPAIKQTLIGLCALALFGFGFGSFLWSDGIAAEPGVVEIIEGRFQAVWVDDFENPEKSYLQFLLLDDEGAQTEVFLEEGLLKSLGGVYMLSGRHISLLGETLPDPLKGVKVHSILQIGPPQGLPQSGGEGIVEDLNEPMFSALAVTGEKPYVTIACRFNDRIRRKDPPLPEMSYFAGLMGSVFPGVDHYFREVSYGNVNLTGSTQFGWYTMPAGVDDYCHKDSWDITLMLNDCTAAADSDVYFPDYYGINLAFNEVCPGARGTLGANWTLTRDGITKQYGITWLGTLAWQRVKTVAHEIGHNFGWVHSAGPDLSNFHYSYWDVMSNGAYDIGSIYGEIPTDTISYNKDMAGWIPPGQKFIATPNSSETITLERLDQPTDGGTAFLMAEIPIDADRFYTVEARRFAGYDQGIPGEAVILHEVQPSRTYDALVVDPDGNGDPNDEGAMWRVGETFEDPVNEISVSVDSDTGTGYIVTIARNQSMQEPDLRSTQVSGVPVRLLPGETLTITDAVFNDGPGDVVDAFDVGFFLSINSTIDLNDIFLGSRTVNNLAFGASSQDSTAVVIPPGTPGRLYYLGAIADYADSIAEGDETDNALRGNTITVETPPFVDLTVTAVNGPKSGRIGETITITTTVRNGGNIATVGNFDLGIYLSTDTTITTDDILRALISVGPMAVGESRTFNTDVLIQGFIEPGTYYPGAIADEGDVIVESDETNNAVAGSRIRIK